MSDLDFVNATLNQDTADPSTQPSNVNGTSQSSESGKDVVDNVDVAKLSHAQLNERVEPDSALGSVLSSLQSTLQHVSMQDVDNLDDEAVEQLLRRMEEADKAAEGLEGRLDQLLGQIDGMLDVLDPEQSASTQLEDNDHLSSKASTEAQT
ncbi:hypothetical protein OIO90_006127 [Microbotryomycetes sp. JL221]|nr:hypothetical protein OIO90_006127 [Microbotryomycetes sp. JL221]